MISAWWLLLVIPVAMVAAGAVYIWVIFQIAKGINR